MEISNQLEKLRNSLKKDDVDSNLDGLLENKEVSPSLSFHLIILTTRWDAQQVEKEIVSTTNQYQPLKEKIAAMDAVSNPLKEQRAALEEKIKKLKKTIARTHVRSLSFTFRKERC